VHRRTQAAYRLPATQRRTGKKERKKEKKKRARERKKTQRRKNNRDDRERKDAEDAEEEVRYIRSTYDRRTYHAVREVVNEESAQESLLSLSKSDSQPPRTAYHHQSTPNPSLSLSLCLSHFLSLSLSPPPPPGIPLLLYLFVNRSSLVRSRNPSLSSPPSFLRDFFFCFLFPFLLSRFPPWPTPVSR
jgi:hypothetical protein